VTMEIPPAGNRGSKLVALGLPVVTRVPWEPEAFAEPLALPDCVDWSLSSPLCVGVALSVGLFVVRGAELCGACDEASCSGGAVSMFLRRLDVGRHTVVLSAHQNILDAGEAVDIVKSARDGRSGRGHCHDGREQLSWPHVCCGEPGI
jgi:hypothetical protein